MSFKQVTATDGDKDRQQNIVYFLTGQGIDPDNPANSKFDINRTTGDIFVLKVSGTKLCEPILSTVTTNACIKKRFIKWDTIFPKKVSTSWICSI